MTYKTSSRDVKVLEATNLDIFPGEFVSLIGPSGCGKSTLLRLVAGLLPPSAGQILWKGQEILGPDRHRCLSFQQPHLFPWLSVQKNVEFGPKNRGLSRKEQRECSNYYLSLVKLTDFADSYPHELSGGMQQRVALARALANEPQLLLLDEPLGALDALTREHMQDELKAIWQRTGCAIILVTHSVDEAVYLGTRILVNSHRPARIIFDHPGMGHEGREAKNRAEFLALKDQVLSYVWD